MHVWYVSSTQSMCVCVCTCVHVCVVMCTRVCMHVVCDFIIISFRFMVLNMVFLYEVIHLWLWADSCTELAHTCASVHARGTWFYHYIIQIYGYGIDHSLLRSSSYEVVHLQLWRWFLLWISTCLFGLPSCRPGCFGVGKDRLKDGTMSSSVTSGGCLACPGEAGWPWLGSIITCKLLNIPFDQDMISSGNSFKLILCQEVEWGGKLYGKLMMQHTDNSWSCPGHTLTLDQLVWEGVWDESLDRRPAAMHTLSLVNPPHFLCYQWLLGFYVNVARATTTPFCNEDVVRSDCGRGGITPVVECQSDPALRP